MHPTLRRCGLAAIALLVLAPVGSAADKPALPGKTSRLIDVLLRSPEFEVGKLAPDGAHFAYLREIKSQRVLDCYEFKTGKIYRLVPPTEATTRYLPGEQHVSTNISQDPFSGAIIPAPPPPTPNSVLIEGVDQQIGNFFWLGPNQLIVQDDEQSLNSSGLWVADARLQKVAKLDTGNRYLVPRAALPANPDSAILAEVTAKTPYTSLWRVNKTTLTLREAEPNPGRVIAWHLDQAGQVRLATVDESNGNTSSLYRAAGEKDWESMSLPNLSRPVTFDAAGQSVLVSFPGPGGRRQLQDFSLSARQFTGNPLADPVYDLNPDVISDPKTGMTVGLQYEAAKPAFLWLNGQYAQIHATLQASFPGAIIQIHGVTEAGEVLFTASSDVSPPVLYRFNTQKREVRAVLSALPEAAKTKWAPMQAVAFPARDGATLHGYLTLPLNHAAGRKVPLVALAHGGPDDRDAWGFDPEVQFFAALGYGVLQVNYRGSTGYGQDYALKNSVEVCEKSVDDVADGIKWVIAEGHADPARVAACGESYGGYIALGLATRYPDLIAASVGISGTYDWEGQLKVEKVSTAQLRKLRKDFYLDPKAAADRYRPFSPALAAAKVRGPVLLLHAREDDAVAAGQDKKMSRALRDAGKSVEVVKNAEGTHGQPGEAARRTCYGAIATFLLKNVPPDPAP